MAFLRAAEYAVPPIDSSFNIRYYRDVLAMVFATEEINQTPELLPNITLGFQIFDSCMSERRAISRVLELLSAQVGAGPHYSCAPRPLLAGIVGETMASLSIPMARLMGPLHYPQVSHATVISSLSDKVQFPSFLRTVPSYTFQNTALARLIVHFQWTWVGMVVSTDEVGLQGGQGIRKGIEDHGGCVAYVAHVNLLYPKEKVLQVADMIREHAVKVIIVHSNEVHVKVLLQTLYAQNITSKVLIFTASFTITPGLLSNRAWNIFQGSLGLVPHTDSMLDFEAFLYHLHPSRYPNDVFIKLFWEQAFHCTFQEANWTGISAKEGLGRKRPEHCSGEETMETVVETLFELNDLSYTYHSYIATYAFAHALHTLISCKPGQGPFSKRLCADVKDIRPWQILHYLKSLHFKSRTGNEISFDVNGDAPAAYDILNVQITPDEQFNLVKVGKIDPAAENGEDIIISSGAILWSDGSSKVPRSVCSDACPPGHRKAAREGEPVCCYDCAACSPGEISNSTNAAECFKCLETQWPNKRRDACIEKVIEYLSCGEPLGLIFIISAAFLALLTASILFIFIRFRDTPIVRSSNLGLSYLLLASLMLCFLCSAVFIGQPSKLTCMLRQMIFGVIFTISVSSVLAKTIIVVIAFKATDPTSPARKWLGKKTPTGIVFFGSIIQIVICATWILRSPPFRELNFRSYNDKIIIECNEGDPIFFYCMLGYMGLLATVSFIVAFLSRNLPGSFNEAKLITFSMLVFVSVWISFIPAYLSTRGKYMVAVEVFAILCSSAGLLSCIYLPKCFIILARPNSNTRTHLLGKKHLAIHK
ncbi:extracellular calcium-sensing receptor-like [Ambystoma mexicanum]|uniref:extracellular calcium-sensing receptor-like n=1 Tax=Ambystoma mexicanum TaxID=8296 RepID=UPI0037E777A8